MKAIFGGICLFLALIMTEPGFVAGAPKDHTNLVTKYEGTESCTRCHRNTAKEVAESLHYLQIGEPRFLANWPKDAPTGRLAGMMNSF
ncbi:MAG: hypothetical protein A4E65_02878 [Syntrophorhabdus sp. PtaU1.Bin153]|nr:MAG: hypothetical protein A4E65_02878 [Syntrophorhabdus sp. PtaU1.Bin153]